MLEGCVQLLIFDFRGGARFKVTKKNLSLRCLFTANHRDIDASAVRNKTVVGWSNSKFSPGMI